MFNSHTDIKRQIKRQVRHRLENVQSFYSIEAACILGRTYESAVNGGMVLDDTVDLMDHADSRKDFPLLDTAWLQKVQKVVDSRESVLGKIIGHSSVSDISC